MRSSLVIVSISMTLFVPCHIAAQDELPCEVPLQVVMYDGCLLPDDPAQQYPWEEAFGSQGEPYISDCQLVIPVDDEFGFHYYRRDDEAFAGAESYSMEAMVRVEEFFIPGTLTSASIGISDGQKYAEIRLEHSPGSEEKRVVVCDSRPGCATVWLDWGVYHRYSMEVNKSGQARFYVDAQLIHEVEYGLLQDSNISPNIALFLGAESVSWWDWVSGRGGIPRRSHEGRHGGHLRHGHPLRTLPQRVDVGIRQHLSFRAAGLRTPLAPA